MRRVPGQEFPLRHAIGRGRDGRHQLALPRTMRHVDRVRRRAVNRTQTWGGPNGPGLAGTDLTRTDLAGTGLAGTGLAGTALAGGYGLVKRRGVGGRPARDPPRCSKAKHNQEETNRDGKGTQPGLPMDSNGTREPAGMGDIS